MTPDNIADNISNFCSVVGRLSSDLIAAGVGAEPLAAALRIEVARVEDLAPRPAVTVDVAEMLDMQRKAHEFINAIQVAGITERIAVAAIGNALVERVTRTHGAPGAANWLRRLAVMVEESAAEIEATARSH